MRLVLNMRRLTKQINSDTIKIGSDYDISVQSMLNVPATNVEGSVLQAIQLEKAGCIWKHPLSQHFPKHWSSSFICPTRLTSSNFSIPI